MEWKKQGSAAVANVALAGGGNGTIVIVGPRDNARGAVLVIPQGNEGDVEKLPFSKGIEHVSPRDAVSILVMQERLHGESGLKPPAELA